MKEYAFRKKYYDNKDVNQIARMCMLVCAFVVRMLLTEADNRIYSEENILLYCTFLVAKLIAKRLLYGDLFVQFTYATTGQPNQRYRTYKCTDT